MKRWKYVFVVMAMAGSWQAAAVQFGVQAARTFGDIESSEQGADEFDGLDLTEVGFLLDTSTPERVFSYRLALSYFFGKTDFCGYGCFYNGTSDTADASGVDAANSFAFRVNGPGGVRVWLGPTVYLSTFKVDSNFSGSSNGAGVGFGPSLGLNIPFAQGGAAFTLDLSYRYMRIVFNEGGDYSDNYDLRDFIVRAGFLFGG